MTLEDRTHFAVLRDAANEIVYSRSRRDSDGRLIGTSPLALSELASQHLQRSRIPQHAFSESDRLLARRQEFSETERAQARQSPAIEIGAVLRSRLTTVSTGNIAPPNAD